MCVGIGGNGLKAEKDVDDYSNKINYTTKLKREMKDKVTRFRTKMNDLKLGNVTVFKEDLTSLCLNLKK